MAIFHVLYGDDNFGVARRIEFEADDAFAALSIVHNQATGRTAELWEGLRKLCTLRRTGPEGTVWEVGPGEIVAPDRHLNSHAGRILPYGME